jgi:hypothetical protein
MTGPTKRSTLTRYALAILAALALVGLFVVTKRALDIDSCMDRGGAWDHENNRCDGARTNPSE